MPVSAEDEGGGERAISWVLRAGVVVAGLLLAVALGGSLLLGLPLGGRGATLARIWSGQEGGLQSLALLGILSLGITPVARVALSIPVFARAGEKRQALIGAGVLVLLVVSMLLGAVEGG